MSIKDKTTGETIEIRAKKFVLQKDTYDFIQGIIDSYRSYVQRETGQQISENKALEFMCEEVRQLHQNDFNIIKQI